MYIDNNSDNDMSFFFFLYNINTFVYEINNTVSSSYCIVLMSYETVSSSYCSARLRYAQDMWYNVTKT